MDNFPLSTPGIDLGRVDLSWVLLSKDLRLLEFPSSFSLLCSTLFALKNQHNPLDYIAMPFSRRNDYNHLHIQALFVICSSAFFKVQIKVW